MENQRNRLILHLVQTSKMATKKASSPTFERVIVFHENLVGMQMMKKSLMLNRPIYTGFAILDLSKLFL